MGFRVPRVAAGAVLIGLAGFGAGGATAQAPDLRTEAAGSPGRPSRGMPVDAVPGSFGRCIRQCAADLSPCDPDYYKVADRRCNPNQSGYYY